MNSCHWLVILIIHDFEQEGYKEIIDSIIKEFEDEGVAPENKVLLVHDQLCRDASGQVKFKTAFKELVLYNQAPPLYCFKDILKEVVEFDYHDGRTWEQLFKWINKEYVAERTALITLSDGAGFALLDDVEDKRIISIKQSNKRYIPESFLRPEFVEKIKTQPGYSERFELYKDSLVYTDGEDFCKALDMLWITELANALENGFTGRKIDVLMMVNCYMQTFETGWLLRKKVKYLIATETIFKAFGYAFDKLMRVINTNSSIKPVKLIKTIIPDFVVKWKDPEKEWHLKMVSVSINDLGYYGILKFFFERIAKMLNKCSDRQFLKMIEFRQCHVENASSIPLQGTDRPSDAILIQMVDMNHLFNTVKKIFPYKVFLWLSIWFFRVISKVAIRHIYIGDDYPHHDRITRKKFRLSGISIYLPNNLVTARNAEIANCAYFGTTEILFNVFPDIPLEPFTKTSSWDEFVERYIKLLAATNPNNQTGHSAINAQP
jgi:hypothetical protein